MDRPRLLLTRPEPAARRFLSTCEITLGRPIFAILSPVFTVRPVEIEIEQHPGGVILTSENGAVRAGELGLSGLPAWCVGRRTADVARAAGLLAIEAGPDVEALLARLLREAPSEPLLHLRGLHARGEVIARLCAAGISAQDAIAYRQDPLTPTPEARRALDSRDALVVPLFSPRSAALLKAWEPVAPLHIVALSPAVAEAAQALRPVSMVVAARPEGEAIVELTYASL
jgi:uroporphyrinogen-III synthase